MFSMFSHWWYVCNLILHVFCYRIIVTLVTVYGVVLVLVIIGQGWAILSLTKLRNMFSVQFLIHSGKSW